MHNRVALILSQGMLLEKVDASGFIAKLVKKAITTNPQFNFNTVKLQAFILAEEFNQNKHTPVQFQSRLLQLLGVSMSDEEFWAEWNKIVTVGEINKKIQQLQALSNQHRLVIYLTSDTNLIHLNKIAEECKEQEVSLDMTTQPMTLGNFPLYATCSLTKNRAELIQHIASEIQVQQFKPDKTIVLLGNPENVKDTSLKMAAEQEVLAITGWCNERQISVELHNNQDELEATITRIFNPAVVQEHRSAMAM